MEGKSGKEFKWGEWTKPYDYLLAEARYGYGRKATDIVGYAWDADLHTPEETLKALKAGVLKATDPKARLDQHKIPERGVEDREGNEIHPVFASDPEAKEFDESVEVTEATIDTDRISRKIAAVVNEYADNLLGGLGDHADLPYMRAYSGRAMYGKYCLGVSVGRYDMNDLLKEFKRNSIPEPSKDALGMGAILYWQNIPHDPKIHINHHVKDESVEVTEDLGDSTMGGVNFYKERTEPYQGLPDEAIIGCYRGGKKIAEIWQDREDPKNHKKVTGYTVYPPWIAGGGALGQEKWSKSFGTREYSKPRYPSLNAAFAAARKFVVGLKTEEVEFRENAVPAAAGQATLKAGDILVCEWGVGMSLVDFYKVVSVSGDWVTLVELGDKKTGDWASGTTVATSVVVGGNIRKKMRRWKDYRGNERISVIINASAKQYATLWDGRPVFYNTMD